MAREWQSAEYHRLSDPQFGWGLKVIDRLRTQAGPQRAQVLDAGCGTGRVTAELLRIFPHWCVTAIDASANMIGDARTTLAEFGDRVTVQQLDLIELSSTQEFDVIFSTAVFHWIKDQDRLFRNLFRALRPGGLLCAQCGGGPNLERIRRRIQKLVAASEFHLRLKDVQRIWEYPGPELMAERLRRAGFAEVQTGLEEAPVHLPDEQQYRDFVAAMIVHPYLERLSSPLQRQFMDALAREARQDDPPFVLDYWRLNLSGRKLA